MQNLKEKYIERVRELIRMAVDMKSDRHNTEGKFTNETYYKWATSCKSLLNSMTGQSSDFYQDFVNILKYRSPMLRLAAGIGILNALKEEIESGLLVSVQTLALSEVFSDFLEMAEHLLESGYKDPTASLIGAVLENGLQKLAEKNNIPLKPRDDISALNTKLADKKIYTRLTQSQIQAWKKLRDNAAHGKFAEYDEKDVKAFLDGTRAFLVKHLS